MPAGRRITASTAIGWAALLGIIKAHKKLSKGLPVRNIYLYSTSCSTISQLCNTSSKPAGKALSIALCLAIEDVIDKFPDVSIKFVGYNLNAFKCFHQSHIRSDYFDDFCAKCCFGGTKYRALKAKHRGKMSFPESQSFEYQRRCITSETISLWHDEFDNENSPFYKGHGFICLYDHDTRNIPPKPILPTHIHSGPWLRSYNGVTIQNDPRLCARFVRAATKHAPIGEYRSRFFPMRDFEFNCPGHENAPETRDHIPNECSWYVRRREHYNGAINTVEGLIHFLCDNPFAFSFTQMDKPRGEYNNWDKYCSDVYQRHKVDNDYKRRKGLPVDNKPIFLHEVAGPIAISYFTDTSS